MLIAISRTFSAASRQAAAEGKEDHSEADRGRQIPGPAHGAPAVRPECLHGGRIHALCLSALLCGVLWGYGGGHPRAVSADPGGRE